MMALAPIVITTSVLTIILQIVLIKLVLDTKKKTNFDLKEKPLSVAPEIRDIRKPREHENRFNNRRPPHDQRTKPSPVVSAPTAPVQNVDPMERSLRDINLRLKNAERDQEKERRRIKDTIAAPPQKRNDFNKSRERNEGFRRNDRPRQDYAQQQRPSPSPVRDERPTVPFDEPRENKTLPSQPITAAVAAQPVVLPPPSPPFKPVIKPVDPIFEIEVSNSIDKENLQHGRKVMVKRRILKAEDEQIDSGKDIDKPLDTIPLPDVLLPQASPESSQEAKPAIEALTALESKDSEDTGSDTPISFGR